MTQGLPGTTVRPFPALLPILFLALAGCAGGDGAGQTPSQADDFDDLDVQATATTGVILGVVVDGAIRPIPEASVTLEGAAGGPQTETSDEQGRFAFGDLEPGTYFLKVSALQFAPAQTSAEVVAGLEDPPVLRVQLERLFAQDPYAELIKFDGYLACSISFPVGTTCVNDYTRIVGGTIPGCEGGCLKDYNVSKTAGNIREYVTGVTGGWQSIIFEATWEPSLDGTAQGLTCSISYFTRPTASHFYASDSQPNPLRIQIDVGKDGDGQNEEPTQILPEGQSDIFVFFNDGGGAGSITVNQQFQSFQTNFYYYVPPEGWSFVAGDPLPF